MEIRLLEESDTKYLTDFFNELYENNKTGRLIKEYKYNEKPSAALLRYSLYNHYEEFIAILKNNEIVGLINLYLKGDNSLTIYIKQIYFESMQIIEELIKYLKNILSTAIFLKDINKARFILDNDDEDEKNLLLKMGFTCILKNNLFNNSYLNITSD